MTVAASRTSKMLYFRRRLANTVFIVLSTCAAIFGLVWLTFILGGLLVDGVSALSPTLFTEITPPPGPAPLPGRPPTETAPAVGGMRPDSSIINVLLPQPDGPTIETNSPAARFSDSGASASTMPARGR